MSKLRYMLVQTFLSGNCLEGQLGTVLVTTLEKQTLFYGVDTHFLGKEICQHLPKLQLYAVFDQLFQ